MEVRVWAAAALAVCSVMASADVTALVALEPTLRKDGLMISRPGLESSLSTVLGQPVTVSTTEDLSDSLRATRSGGYDIFIAPAQVVASALAHGYELLGSTDPAEEYVLVGRPTLHPGGRHQGRAHLPAAAGLDLHLHGARHAHGQRPVLQGPGPGGVRALTRRPACWP
jgi:hypothetical protein